jgi:Uma2 family endonuclease
MATEAKPKLLTAEEFMKSDLGEGTFELVRGKVVKLTPPMHEHAVVCNNVAGLFWDYGRRSGYGYSLCNDAVVVTERGPDTVRGADICFYSHTRRPRKEVGRSLPKVVPDVVVEVVSPGNRRGEIMQKVSEYLNAGVLLVWVVYPAKRKVFLYRPGDEPAIVLGEFDTIENLPELPGFRCAVSELFV